MVSGSPQTRQRAARWAVPGRSVQAWSLLDRPGEGEGAAAPRPPQHANQGGSCQTMRLLCECMCQSAFQRKTLHRAHGLWKVAPLYILSVLLLSCILTDNQIFSVRHKAHALKLLKDTFFLHALASAQNFFSIASPWSEKFNSPFKTQLTFYFP